MAIVDLQQLKDASPRSVDTATRREISLSSALRARLAHVIPNVLELNEFTGSVQSGGNKVIVFPYQYFSIIESVKEYILGLRSYTTVLDGLAEDMGQTQLAEVLYEASAAGLDSSRAFRDFCNARGGVFTDFVRFLSTRLPAKQERDLFLRFLYDSEYRGGKEIANRRNGNYVFRGTLDSFESSVLKVVKVPDVSTAYLGKLAYYVSSDLNLFKDLNAEITAQPAVNKFELLRDATLRTFARGSFIELLRRYDENTALNGTGKKDATVNGTAYKAITHPIFGTDPLIGLFDGAQTTDTLTSANTQRFFEEPLSLMSEENALFSTQWGDTDGTGLTFTNLQRFVDSVSASELKAEKVDGFYVLYGPPLTANKPLNTILYGPPGTGKTHNSVNLAVEIVDGRTPPSRSGVLFRFKELVSSNQVKLITFHQSYSYEEFIEGIRSKVVERNVIYEVDDGVFKKFCDDASKDLSKNYVLIIDEINRGNISKIFGELITLIEPSKRSGRPEQLMVRLAYSGSDTAKPSFSVPQNVYIVGTMNSTDRSIALIDTALRRRFTFIEYAPDPSLLNNNIEGVDLQKLLNTINDRIEILLDKDHRIGHAYFMGVSSAPAIAEVFRNQIIPLLEEYFFGDFEKIQYVLGDNAEWGKKEAEKLIQLKAGQDHRTLFGTEIEGFEERAVFRVNQDLDQQRFSNLGSDVFTSIYLKPGTAGVNALEPAINSGAAQVADDEIPSTEPAEIVQ